MAMHNLAEFNNAVKKYKRLLRSAKGNVLIFGLIPKREAFFSLAPLSMALHDLGHDVHASLSSSEKSNLKILERIWRAYEENGREGKLLREFISCVEKKDAAKGFSNIFKRPGTKIEMKEEGFVVNGKNILPYNGKWFRRYDVKKVKETCRKIVNECYALKKAERFSISFALVPCRNMLELPLEDYLDSFAIAYHTAEEARRHCIVTMSASTQRKSKLEMPEPIAELAATISACEYEKDIKEKPFQIFKKISKLLKINEWRYNDASFSIVGKGYHGKHIFGIAIGYPSADRKTRWASPGQMFLKPWWHEQTWIDKRKPMTRVAITETIPIEEFVQCCNVDYAAMRARDIKIKKILEKSTRLVVEGKCEKGLCTRLVVDLGKGKRKCFVQRSDSDVRRKIDAEVFKRFGILSGMYDNIPGGEVFFTPKKISGTAIGDVVINIDRSYVLNEKRPLVLKFSGKNWEILRAEPLIKRRIKEELSDARKLIKKYEKNKSLPKKIIATYKKNFFGVGEFAINTNTKAKLSRYLIVNEKLAKMIHIALGSGFEPGTQTLYHWDFVINVPRQRISIRAIGKGFERFIIKEGSLVV